MDTGSRNPASTGASSRTCRGKRTSTSDPPLRAWSRTRPLQAGRQSPTPPTSGSGSDARKRRRGISFTAGARRYALVQALQEAERNARPARAGIRRLLRGPETVARAPPRPRGDAPHETSAAKSIDRVSPRARGYAGFSMSSLNERIPRPARAGIRHPLRRHQHLQAPPPRPRGDTPGRRKPAMVAIEPAPRARGFARTRQADGAAKPRTQPPQGKAPGPPESPEGTDSNPCNQG